MNEEVLRGKFVGALLGTFVGDALGAPVEGWPPDRIADTLEGIADLPAGARREMFEGILGLLSGGSALSGIARYTDDTQMMIGVAESLAERGDFDGADMAERFAENFEGNRGYGPGAHGVMLALRRGAVWNEVAPGLFGGSGSLGNGAAMRVAPVGVFYHDDPAELRRVAELQSTITHTHPLGKEGAALLAYAVACAARHAPGAAFAPDDFLSDLHAFVHPDRANYSAHLTAIGELLERRAGAAEVIETLGNDVTAPGSVPTAIYAFLAHPDSFSEAVTVAVRLGGDADTIGAMTGAIAGAFHGAEAIPEDWLSALENGAKGRDYVRHLAESLYETWRQARRPGNALDPGAAYNDAIHTQNAGGAGDDGQND